MADRLECIALSKFYGKKHVVKDVTFSMCGGEITGLLGLGFIKANGGKILLNGEEITHLAMHERSKRGLAYLPQEASIFRKLTVEDNIKLILEEQKISRDERKRRLEELLVRFGIDRVRRQYGYTLSGGERRRTEIARALATSPKFLLLDEPFAGIDPKAVFEIKEIIRQLASDGIGILLTDHNVRDTLEITHSAHIISDGSIIVSGTREELIENEMAREIYFGSSFEG